MSLSPGDVIKHRYRIDKSLGQGGFGTVYRGYDLSFNAPCAIKENLDYLEGAQRQFEREARILAGLRHPSLPRVTDFFTIPAQGQYLVMDFVEGYDLQTVIDRVRQPLFEKKVLGWIDQICDALAYLHSQKPAVIHRDVKPGNIKITPSGRAMLVDFGIAKTYDPNIKTTIGARAVTPGYSPVEQYGHGKTDTRADLYALGATLYTLLTGHRPPESIGRITGESLVSPRQLNPSLSPHVEQVILRAMEVLAANRFASVIELREALKKPGPLPPGPARQESGSEQPAFRSLAAASQTPDLVSTPISRPATNRIILPTHRAAAAMDWITIPEGAFAFGEDKMKIELPAYQIAKYPVTNQQYKHFLDANSIHPAPLDWKGRDFPKGKALHPVVKVSLYDAVAFCEWLGCRLPSDEEWEKAGRGVDGRSYPWGEGWEDGKYCNNWEAGIKGTTPVDRYPEGVSPFGIWDMVGNVWEWTTSEYRGPFMHVLRGGSWRLFGSFNLRAVQRDWLILDDSRDDLGFRCARSL